MGGKCLKKLLFLYNPYSGRGVIKEKLSEIVELFCENDYEVTIYSTKKTGDARSKIIATGMNYDIVVCSGGDGTLNEVTDGLMTIDNPPPCGYIPAGTVNDFAKSFKLPKDMTEAAGVAITGSPVLCDIGEINGGYFDYIAAFGAFTQVSYETSQITKNILGKLAYFFEGVKKLPYVRKYAIEVTAGEEHFEDEIIYGMITNSFSVGGFLSLFDDDVALDDGKLEAFFIKAPKNVIEFQVIINALLTSDVSCKYFYYYHVSEVTVKCDEEIAWTVDGEYGGDIAEARINVHKQAVAFVRGDDE